MLFLAVFSGFLAEYQLEHKIERDRVKKYMHDMVLNLQYDTTRIANNVPGNMDIRQEIDSFRYEIKKTFEGKGNTNRLYYYSLKVQDFGMVAFNRSSITQLKNSGQLRLVKNDQLVNNILDYYDRKVFAAELYQRIMQEKAVEFNAMLSEVFSTTEFDFLATAADTAYSIEILAHDTNRIEEVLSMPPIPLLRNDRMTLEKLHTSAVQMEWSLINYNRFLNYVREGAKELIALIEEAY